MDSLDVQCFVAHLVEVDASADLPAHWRHLRDGTLTYRFTDSPNEYTWFAKDTAEVAARWRELGVPPPESVRALVEAHERFVAMLESASTDQPAPDAVYHNLDVGEITAVWSDRKVAVIIEDVLDAAA